MVKRIAACVLVLACLVSLLVVPASAADDLTGTGTFRYLYDGYDSNDVSPIVPQVPITPGSLEIAFPATDFGRGIFYTNYRNLLPRRAYSIALDRYTFYAEELSGSVSVYLSFYFLFNPADSNVGNMSHSWQGEPEVELQYVNAVGGTGTAPVEYSTFDAAPYTGYVLKGSTFADELEPISDPALVRTISTWYWYWIGSFSSEGGSLFRCMVPSARIISAASSADTEYLESIADEIAQGNQQANAFYGDIMAILNEIYSKESEIALGVDQIAGYILQVLNELTSIGDDVQSMYSLMSTYLHYLEAIAQDTESIDSTLTQFHTDFMTMLQTLISTVTSESDDIQAKMEEIYNMLIAYLNQQFGEAVPDGIDQDISDTTGVIDQTDQIESEWQDDMTSGWGDLDLQNYTLPTSLLAGVVWVSSWFTNIFNAYGADWTQILLVPALFGVVMLAIGMISRHSGGGRGGGGRGGGGDSDSTSNTSDGSWHYTDHY